jgi:hypothetical protein
MTVGRKLGCSMVVVTLMVVITIGTGSMFNAERISFIGKAIVDTVVWVAAIALVAKIWSSSR